MLISTIRASNNILNTISLNIYDLIMYLCSGYSQQILNYIFYFELF